LILVSCLILVPRLDVPNWKRERIYLLQGDELEYRIHAQLEWGTLVNLFGESFGNFLRVSSGSMSSVTEFILDTKLHSPCALGTERFSRNPRLSLRHF
jgi:hypothetical protein